MKKLTRLQHTRVTLFLLIVIASLIGNGMGYWLLKQENNLPENFAEEALAKLDKLEKMQRDLEYRNAQFEQANKENRQLQQALEFHQQLLDKSSTPSTKLNLQDQNLSPK
jgi:hypothetical protein